MHTLLISLGIIFAKYNLFLKFCHLISQLIFFNLFISFSFSFYLSDTNSNYINFLWFCLLLIWTEHLRRTLYFMKSIKLFLLHIILSMVFYVTHVLSNIVGYLSLMYLILQNTSLLKQLNNNNKK